MMKKTAAWLAASLLVTSLCACGESPDVPGTAATEAVSTPAPAEPTDAPTGTEAPEELTKAQTEAPVPQNVSLAGGFRIITTPGDGENKNYSTVLTALVAQFKKHTVFSYTLASDSAAAADDGKPEVIFGNANRPGCPELYAALAPMDYTVTVKNGSIYVLGGTSDATAKAMNWFLTNCVAKDRLDYPDGELYRYVSPEKLPELPTLPEQNFDALRGLTLYAIGDSYFAGEGLNPRTEVWPALMAAKYGMTFENYGKGGSTVSDFITTNTPMCRRIADMKDGKPDIVLLEGGANDWNHNVPLGEAGSRDTATFRGAVASCIEQLHAKYPDALIVCITNWEYGKANSQKVQTTEFAKAMLETAAAYPYTVGVDATDTARIPAIMTNAVFRTKYCIASTDQNHLNKEGMRLMLPFFEKIIGEQYTALRSKK